MTIWPKNLFKAKHLTQKFITSYKIDRKYIFFSRESTLKKWHILYPNIWELSPSPPPPPPRLYQCCHVGRSIHALGLIKTGDSNVHHKYRY